MKIRSLADWFNCLTELWHSIVNHTFILAPLVVAGTTCISGCNFTKEKNQKTYETVQANERYDTETARRQHAKGLLSPVENGGASRWKMAARGIEGLSGLAPGEPGNGIG